MLPVRPVFASKEVNSSSAAENDSGSDIDKNSLFQIAGAYPTRKLPAEIRRQFFAESGIFKTADATIASITEAPDISCPPTEKA